jgi:L-2-hydroxyglutarate oxidase LhgO
MEFVDSIVVGSGIVGLAVARALACTGHEVLVIESESQIGLHTSSRNSEVIHAGLYYPKGSLKAQLCVAGRYQLYRYCETHSIDHRRCGKLIVSTSPAEMPQLNSIFTNAVANGVDDLVPMNAREAHALEPRLFCTGALFSPSTGILDSHAYMLALQGDAEDNGAIFVFRTPFLRTSLSARGFVVNTGGAEPFAVGCSRLVNAAGLGAPEVANHVEGLDPKFVPSSRYAKGNYFTLAGRAPFSRLIYPVPELGGLGVHLTLDLAGQARFGPDVEWVDRISYSVDPARSVPFYAAIRRYWPEIEDGALAPAYAGIRPKLSGPGEPAEDFRISGPAEHGIPGLVNLFGIESPGLTSSLAIADEVSALLSDC